jgi:hypothetical protein
VTATPLERLELKVLDAIDQLEHGYLYNGLAILRGAGVSRVRGAVPPMKREVR